MTTPCSTQEATRSHGAGVFMTREIERGRRMGATVRVWGRCEVSASGAYTSLLFNTEAQVHKPSNMGIPRAGTGLALHGLLCVRASEEYETPDACVYRGGETHETTCSIVDIDGVRRGDNAGAGSGARAQAGTRAQDDYALG